jgi:hypothetical protein
MKHLLPFLILLVFTQKIFAQSMMSPAQTNNFQKVTSYAELSDYIKMLDRSSDLLSIDTLGQSVEGRNIYGLRFALSDISHENPKLNVLIFAQQHGNEQSGKEGALLLAAELLKPANQYLFSGINLVIVPQVNPDGAEINTRRNANQADLNRNHLLLSQPETQALHTYFERFMFEASMDVHEYSPFGDDWKKYGYRKNSQVTYGSLTNINIPASLRKLTREKALPFIFKYLNNNGISSFEYVPGGPPEEDYMRHSTFDINDGRQGFGALCTFSLIQEGMNGEDSYVQNLASRANSQMLGMRAYLEFVYQNSALIKKTVQTERKNLLTKNTPRIVSIQSDHYETGKKLRLPVYSYATGKDSVIEVTHYRPAIKSLTDVTKPLAYLIPKSDTLLVKWAQQQHIIMLPLERNNKIKIEGYMIKSMDSIDFERDTIVDPVIETKTLNTVIQSGYYFIPTSQIKSNVLVQALEPKSMLGLATYPSFAYLLKVGELFPVLRVIE